MTFLPNIAVVPDMPNVVLIDFPGFFDSQGPEINIGIDLSFRHLINWCMSNADSVHVLALVAIGHYTEGRGQNLSPLLQKLQRQLPGCTWAWGVTKCSKEFGMYGERAFCELRNWLVNRTDGLPQDAEVFNMNLYMLSQSKKEARERKRAGKKNGKNVLT